MRIVLMLIFTAIVQMSCTGNSNNSSDPKAEVEQAVEEFRQTMLAPDQAKFEALTSPVLTYGHSNGLVEDRETCIASMVSGKFKFLSLELTEQTIALEGETAIVRHLFYAHTHDEGKDPGEARLKVLQVWHKDGDNWRLLARQAVKN